MAICQDGFEEAEGKVVTLTFQKDATIDEGSAASAFPLFVLSASIPTSGIAVDSDRNDDS